MFLNFISVATISLMNEKSFGLSPFANSFNNLEDNVSSYRLIILLSVLGKVFKRCIYIKVTKTFRR